MFLTSIAYSKDKLLIHKNQLLSEAKANLIKSGWKPYPTGKPEDLGLIQEPYIKKGYIEIDNCGASSPYCEFNYKKQSRCLKLIAGSFEEPVEESRVATWRFDCK